MERYVNGNIHGPEGALLTLQHIDLERLRDSQMQAKLIFYTGRGDFGTGTCIYNGKIAISNTQAMCLADIALPPVKYRFFSKDDTDFSKEIVEHNLVPGRALFELPGNLEFSISAATAEEYRGLVAFREVLIPELFKRGYNQKNPLHTSVFWLYAGKERFNNENPIMRIDSFDGLTVSKSEVDGVKVLTEMDLQRLMNLQM